MRLVTPLCNKLHEKEMNRLKILTSYLKISPSEICEELGVSKATVSRWIHNINQPNELQTHQLAKYMNVPYNEFFYHSPITVKVDEPSKVIPLKDLQVYDICLKNLQALNGTLEDLAQTQISLMSNIGKSTRKETLGLSFNRKQAIQLVDINKPIENCQNTSIEVIHNRNNIIYLVLLVPLSAVPNLEFCPTCGGLGSIKTFEKVGSIELETDVTCTDCLGNIFTF